MAPTIAPPAKAPGVRALTFREQSALRLLYLLASNRRPPANLRDHPNYRAFLATKEFRGAMALWNVELDRDAAGNALAIRFAEEEDVGYTPYPVYAGSGSMRGGRRICRYRRGLVGIPEPTTATVSGDRGVITKSFRFRLDEWGDRYSRWLVGSPSPDAWVGLQYEIRTDGLVRVEFSGSFIPSQCYYSGWQVRGDHDMGNNSAGDTLGFFHAGAAVRSPGQVHFVWP